MAVAAAAVIVGFVIWQSRREKIDADVYPRQEIHVDGIQRTFRLVVPHGLNGPAPLVFAFHGIGDAPDAMPKYAALDKLACEHEFVLVYPVASSKMWRTEGPVANTAENPDLKFFDALLEHLKQREQIDDERIYLMGMSNGASFAQLLAFQRSDEVAAVVAHSGPLPKEWWSKKPKRPFPILLAVGANDAVGAIEGTAMIYQNNGQTMEFLVVPGIGHTWAKNHNEQFWRFLAKHRR
ncbi:MAG: alpha/beta hydrolase family esterase [Pirellulaceae bacterium]